MESIFSLYISGHAPWSNGYESVIYIAWATMLSGFVYVKKSVLTLAATSVVGALLLMVAHLNWLDPEITNLVPVLNSYWLMIHVAIIAASYGFFVLGSVLGLIALWLLIFTNSNNKYKFEKTLSEIIEPVDTVFEKQTVENVLNKFTKNRSHMFIVKDEFGGTTGIVTLEDCIETLLGVEIMDESDEVADMRELAKDQLRQKRQSDKN